MTTNTQLCAFPTAADLPDRARSLGPHAALSRGRAAAGAVIDCKTSSEHSELSSLAPGNSSDL